MKLEWTETGKIKRCVFHEEAASFRQDDYGGPAWQCRLGEELRTSTAPRYREGWFKDPSSAWSCAIVSKRKGIV